jgi:biotin carboxylase
VSWLVLVESNTTGSGRLFCARARDLGLRPVVLARDPARYPWLADDRIDTRRVGGVDPAAVRELVDRLDPPVAGVTSSSEYFVATAGEVARGLGLPHPDPDAVRACRDKATQRERLRDAGVPGAGFAAATTPAGAVAAADRLGYPVVVKPVAGSGSIATRRCPDAAAVAAAARAVLATDPRELALPPQRAVLVEAYLSGPEFSVETFDDAVVGVTRKHLGPEPHFVEVGHDFPAALDPATRAAVGETARAALRALGLGWGPAHVELRVTATGPRIVEVNPRLAGGMIPRMVQAATGVDLIGQTVARAAGHPTDLTPTATRAAAIRFLVAETAGHLVEVEGVAEARRVPGVVEVGLTRAPGQDLVLRHSFQDRLGYVVAAGPDPAAASHAAEAGRLALKARIVPAGPPPAPERPR